MPRQTSPLPKLGAWSSSVGVNILLGPLSGDEGVAVSNYAKTQPGVTFVNGTSGAQSTTLTIKAPNFFRFGGDGAQWMAGLGTYAYKTLHWRKVAILGEDYSYPYTQAAGFIEEFCSLGGQIANRTWVALGTTDWSSYVDALPRNVDGVLLLTGGTDTVAAEKDYIAIGGNPGTHMLGGSSVMDPTSFTVGERADWPGRRLAGTARGHDQGMEQLGQRLPQGLPAGACEQPVHRALLRRHAGHHPGAVQGRW